MRYANFEVPAEVITDFVREMEKREVQAIIVALNEDDELVLKVGYERDESDKVDELEDVLDELIGSLEEEDDESKTRRRR